MREFWLDANRRDDLPELKRLGKMCGRFNIDLSNREINRLVSELPENSPRIKSGEVFPTGNALALILKNGNPAPEAMTWGFPRRDGKGVIFNARAESAMKKPIFRKSLATRPAVIPVSAYYEWRENPILKKKLKFRFFAPDGELLYLAGFWKEFHDQDAARHFTILTTRANESMREYHDRMPVLVRDVEIRPWLKGENRAEILAREPFSPEAAPAPGQCGSRLL